MKIGIRISFLEQIFFNSLTYEINKNIEVILKYLNKNNFEMRKYYFIGNP